MPMSQRKMACHLTNRSQAIEIALLMKEVEKWKRYAADQIKRALHAESIASLIEPNAIGLNEVNIKVSIS